MKKINIFVLGESNSGKSSVLYLIKTILRKEGFVVNGVGGLDYISEETFDNAAQIGINAKLADIKQKNEINIFERQSSPDVIENPWMNFSEYTPHIDQIFWSLDSDNEVRLYRKVTASKLFKKAVIEYVNLLENKTKQIDHIKWFPFSIPTLNKLLNK
jgi:hypothetical protein